jgi:TetR/AcrR family transcriptional regulator, regulator of cefoperazone and chloramphenicol sensitivity
MPIARARKPESRPGADGTPERLLVAAAELFAESGFHATTMRDIASRARANVAASHYHFGSKEDLYLRVLRRQFADIAARLAEDAAVPPLDRLRRMSRSELAAILRARIATMLELLIGPMPSLHGALMQREMCDPTDALPVIVREFLAPQLEDMRRLIEALAPSLSAAEAQRCLFSIGGQVLFYRMMQPVVLRILAREEYPRGFVEQTADHIAAFSLGGIDDLVASQGARRKRRA